jgi:integrase
MAQALWERRKALRPGDEEPLFASKAGTPLDPSNVFATVFKPAARRAGVGWAGFHTLRHTAATLLFRHGANAKQVQAWLGHHDPAFTLATYVHLLPGDLPDPDFLDAVTAGAAELGTETTAGHHDRRERRIAATRQTRS